VTIFLTGYPQKTVAVRKAIRKLVQAYMERYDAELQQKKYQLNQQQQKQRGNKNFDDEDVTSNEENLGSTSRNTQTSDLIVIDLSCTYENFENIAELIVKKTGAMITKKLLELTEECDVPAHCGSGSLGSRCLCCWSSLH